MNRRNAITNLVILSIGAIVLPSCGENEQPVVKLKNFSLTGNEEKMLAQLSDSIIPKTNFIGAADLKAHEFALTMVDDCYEPEKQKKFTAGMRQFDKLAKNKYGNSFVTCSTAEKKAWLTSMEKKKDLPEDVLFFYQTTKNYTVQAFTSSREYMTDVLKYNMVPGSDFKGCIPVKKA